MMTFAVANPFEKRQLVDSDEALLIAAMVNAIEELCPDLSPGTMLVFMLTGQPELLGATPVKWLADGGEVAAVHVAFRRALAMWAR